MPHRSAMTLPKSALRCKNKREHPVALSSIALLVCCQRKTPPNLLLQTSSPNVNDRSSPSLLVLEFASGLSPSPLEKVLADADAVVLAKIVENKVTGVQTKPKKETDAIASKASQSPVDREAKYGERCLVLAPLRCIASKRTLSTTHTNQRSPRGVLRCPYESC